MLTLANLIAERYFFRTSVMPLARILQRHRAVLCGLIVTATFSSGGVAQETNAAKPTLAEVDASNAVDAFKRLHNFLGSKP